MMNQLNRILAISLALLSMMASACGCGSSRRTADPARELMERVKENTPQIAAVTSAVQTVPHEGLAITESDLLMRDSTVNHLFIIEVDLEAGLTLRPSSPGDRPFSKEMGQQTMLLQARAAQENGQEVLLGINGDVFGYYEGLDFFSPRGVHFVDGQDLSTSRGDENVIYVLQDGSVHLDKYEDFQQVEQEVLHAIGGWHTLVWDGQPHAAAEYPEKNLTMFNPRTFFGISEDGRKVFLFVVDGRQKGYSIGLKMTEMVQICQSLGCWRACNLDGGGSTTLVGRQENGQDVDFVLLNRPSDLKDGRRVPRRVANGLLVVEQ